MNAPRRQTAARSNTRRSERSGPEAEERVVNTVVDAIMAHELAPGDRLPERMLSEVSGANRLAIRNGLLRLANLGLVTLNPNRGATVASSSPEEARQIFEARILIEEDALRRLADKLDDAGKARLEEIVRNEVEAYDDGRIEEARHFSRSFHIGFVELAGNAVLARFQRDLIRHQPLLAAARNGRMSQFSGAPAHIKTLAALARGDGDTAARLNTELLNALQREMQLDTAGDAPAKEQTAPP